MKNRSLLARKMALFYKDIKKYKLWKNEVTNRTRLKKLLLKRKRIKNFEHKKVKLNELIRKATFNLNNIKSLKYGFVPQEIENESLNKKDW